MRFKMGKILPLVMVITILTNNVTVNAEASLEATLSSLQEAKPFTQSFIEKASELHTALGEAQKTDPIYNEAQGVLSGATLRVKFMLEELVARLAPPQSIDIYNCEYVKNTLDDVTKVLEMPAFSNRTLGNNQLYHAMLTRIASLEKQAETIAIVEDKIATLSEQSTSEEINDAIATYLKLKDDVTLLSAKNTKHFAEILSKTKVTAVSLPPEVTTAVGLNIYSKEALVPEIKLAYEKVATKKMINSYHVISGFKLTVNESGGKIPLTTFTVTVDGDDGDVVIKSDGEVLKDLDENAQTVTFSTGTLGDFYVAKRDFFKEYSTDFPSLQEYQYQAHSVAMLESDLYSTSGDMLYFNSIGINMLPTALLREIAAANKTIVLEDKSVVYFSPATFLKIDPKDEQSPTAMLYKSSDQTYSPPVPVKLPDVSDEPAIKAEFKTPNMRVISLLASLAVVVTAIAIFVILKREEM